MFGEAEHVATGAVSESVSTVGLIGCGRMGSAMVARLVEAGYRVIAYDAAKPARDRAADLGACPTESAAEVVSPGRPVLLSLPNGEAVRAVLAASGGLFDSPSVGTVVDFSTISLADAESASLACTHRSWRYISCPVIGGMSNCGSWTLLVDPGPAAPAVEDVLTRLGRIEMLESPRAGLKVKLLANMMLATTAAGLMEALDVARAANLDLNTLHRVLTDSGTVAVGPLFTKVLPNALTGKEGNSFGIGLLLKDAGLAADLGAGHGRPTPILDAASDEIRRRSEAYGPTVDFAALLLRIE